jgi:hypothetical protein
LLAACENVAGGSPDTPAPAAAPAISVHPQDAAYLEGDSPAALSVEASSPDGGAISYQWYRATDSKGGGTAIDEATGTSYTPGAQAAGTHYYYALVTNTLEDGRSARAPSARARIQVSTYGPAISVQPQSSIDTNGTSVTLRVSASAPGDGTLSYQWYSNTSNSTVGGSLIAGADTDTYTVTVSGTAYYYVVLTNAFTRGGTAQTLETTSAIAVIGDTSNWQSYLYAYVGNLPGGNSLAAPAYLSLPASFDITTNWNALMTAISSFPKSVALDLSACSMSGSTTFTGAVHAGVSRIVSLVLPTGATTLSGTFSSYVNLTSITGANIVTINATTFQNRSSLTTVNFPAATFIRNRAFDGCTALTRVNIPAATSIGIYAFYGCSSLITVDFPEVTAIRNNAFQACSNLSSVNFPEATSIGDFAFESTALTTAEFPEVTTIGKDAFAVCQNLRTANFKAATTIDDRAFFDCIRLTTADFPAVTTPIGWSAFQQCYALTMVKIPGATGIGAQAFLYCAALPTVDFPDVLTIGDYAFAACTALTTAKFPAATSFGDYVFMEDPADTQKGALTLTLANTAPSTLGVEMFGGIFYQKDVTIEVPFGATDYDDTWKDGLMGAGLSGGNTLGAGEINYNINISFSTY